MPTANMKLRNRAILVVLSPTNKDPENANYLIICRRRERSHCPGGNNLNTHNVHVTCDGSEGREQWDPCHSDFILRSTIVSCFFCAYMSQLYFGQIPCIFWCKKIFETRFSLWRPSLVLHLNLNSGRLSLLTFWYDIEYKTCQTRW